MLVVNSANADSLEIANHYIQMRGIPAGSVVYLNWPNSPFEASVDEFRDRILLPVLSAIKTRQLQQQIDYIIYSAGFPYAINMSSDIGTGNYPIGSITGLTFLHERTLNNCGSIRSMKSNNYAANLVSGGETRGFQAKYGIDTLGQRVPAGEGNRYYLSMMLGHTGGVQNNTVKEVLQYLTIGSKADGITPKGSIYFMKNPNIRSKVRTGQFEGAVAELESLGVRAEIVEAKDTAKECLPLDKTDVQGTMVGLYKHAWSASKSRILPGAICENFTSYGAVMSGQHTKIQTLLADFLRFGAVASSGTVCEPFAFAAKFPHARMHVHYARGCSVAESYYQSVAAPYQLLIVGDPLCKPWAVAPTVEIKGLKPKQFVANTVELNFRAKSRAEHDIRNFNVFVDGLLLGRTLPGRPYRLDTRQLADGHHQLTAVAIEDTPIETQGRKSIEFYSANLPSEDDANLASTTTSGEGTTRSVAAKVASTKPLRKVGVAADLTPRNARLMFGQAARVRVKSDGAREIRLYRGRDLVGIRRGASGIIEVDTSKLGSGPVTLRAVAMPKDRARKTIFGIPFTVVLPRAGIN